MEKKLPAYFVIKRDSDNPLWGKYIKWLKELTGDKNLTENEIYGINWAGDAISYIYYGYDGTGSFGGTHCWSSLKEFENNPTLLTLEEWDEIVNPKTLKVGDVVNLHGLEYEVKKGIDDTYYMYIMDAMNSLIFKKLRINNIPEFTKNILGYYKDGYFPNCNSLEDLTKLVNALKNYKPEQKQDNNMEKITIPEDLFIEGQKAMSKDQLAWFKQNVDPWTRQTTKWFITEYYKKEACSSWKEKIEKAFPFVKENDKSVEVKLDSISTKEGKVILANRFSGEFGSKAICLHDDYNWEIKRDSDNFLCLVPTKK